MESACHTSYCQDDTWRAMITLQTLLDDITRDALPFAWTTFDFAAFRLKSSTKEALCLHDFYGG
jgi:hypothetical protein